jgi:hypothetical protein
VILFKVFNKEAQRDARVSGENGVTSSAWVDWSSAAPVAV